MSKMGSEGRDRTRVNRLMRPAFEPAQTSRLIKLYRQTGFIAIPLAGYAAIAAILAIGGASLWGYVQTQRLASCKHDFAQFQAAVKAVADAQAEIDAGNKEKADADRKKMLAANTTLARRLRDSAGASSLPAPAVADQPDRACFDRGQLDQAIQRFTAGTAAIAIDGQQAVTDLDNAKTWAKK